MCAVGLAQHADAQTSTTKDPVGCDARMYAVSHVPGGIAPYVSLTADGHRGHFLLDWGSTGSSVSSRVFADAKGNLAIQKLNLPGRTKATFHVQKYELFSEPPGGQLGIIGTNTLSQLSVHLAYRAAGDVAYISDTPCAASRREANGYVAIKQTGYFSSNPARVKGRPNVPVLFLSIAGVKVAAQIDSGFDDLAWKHSIDVNEALLTRIGAAGIALERRQETTVATCAGNEMRRIQEYKGEIAIKTERGATIATIKGAHLLPKPRNTCGGIAQMEEPMAQIGASMLKTLGDIVVDGKSGTVWVKRSETTARR
jgi:hypothetical protein